MAKHLCQESVWMIIIYVTLLALVIYLVWHNQALKVPRSVVVQSPPQPTRVPVNVPTRGFYGDFVLVGYLQPIDRNRLDGDVRSEFGNGNGIGRGGDNGHGGDNDNSHGGDNDNGSVNGDPGLVIVEETPMLRLYGRRIDSNRFEYYTMNHNDSAIKITIDVPRDQELLDGDRVHVRGYGPYRAVIYQSLYPSYLPTINF